MKKLIPLLFTVCLASVSCVSQERALTSNGTLAWQDEGAAGMDQEGTAKMMKFMNPGEAHQRLAHRVGTWNVSFSVRMSPGAEQMSMESVSKIKMILGGRYLVEETKGMMMGMPFEGRLTMGYNNVTEEWWTIWMDSMSTGYASNKGKADKDGVINMKGTMVDGMSPEGRPYRAVTSVGEEDEAFTVTMYDTLPDGTEWEVMEMLYSRVQEER